MKKSNKVVSLAHVHLLFLFKQSMETSHWGNLFCKNYPKKRESNVINVFICIQQKYKENSEENMKEA